MDLFSQRAVFLSRVARAARCSPFLSLFLSHLSLPRVIILRLRWPSTRRRVAIDFKIGRRTPCASSPSPSPPPPVVPPSHHPVCPRFPVSAIAAAEPAAVHGDMVQELAARTAKWWSLPLSPSRTVATVFLVVTRTMCRRLWKRLRRVTPRWERICVYVRPTLLSLYACTPLFLSLSHFTLWVCRKLAKGVQRPLKSRFVFFLYYIYVLIFFKL